MSTTAALDEPTAPGSRPDAVARARRIRTHVSLIFFGAQGLVSLLYAVAARLIGGVDLPRLLLAATLMQLGCGVFYVLARTHWSERLRRPSMIVPMFQWSAFYMSAMYALMGPLRTYMLIMFGMTVVWCWLQFGSRLSPKLVASMLVWMGLSMAWVAFGEGSTIVQEGVAAVLTLAAIGICIPPARHRARLREQALNQAKALAEALATNQQLASRDVLTGLLNRRAMTDQLTALERVTGREAAPCALALLDIDWFKVINDTHGHRVGDDVLRRFADEAAAALREGDSVARWGGEEFLVLLPATALDEALRVLQRLSERMGEAGFECIAPGLRLTFSAGVTAWTPRTPHELALERADQALYRAKHEGRNRIVSDDGFGAPSGALGPLMQTLAASLGSALGVAGTVRAAPPAAAAMPDGVRPAASTDIASMPSDDPMPSADPIAATVRGPRDEPAFESTGPEGSALLPLGATSVWSHGWEATRPAAWQAPFPPTLPLPLPLRSASPRAAGSTTSSPSSPLTSASPSITPALVRQSFEQAREASGAAVLLPLDD